MACARGALGLCDASRASVLRSIEHKQGEGPNGSAFSARGNQDAQGGLQGGRGLTNLTTLTGMSRAEGWVSVASGLETEPTPPWSDMSSRVIGLGFPGAA